ncbi:FAD-dependent oxidoreductase [Aestuariivirga sp.]|uniref:FAD-dependent oxidoreductase n=1 Tax=Aestuariivirga sp. TaxID=2650926 RepID=UPI0039E668D1
MHIAICGAGPAGLSAALALKAQGHRITLFEQFETPKPLGSGLILQPTGLAVLDALGVGSRLRGLGARIDRLYGRAAGSDRVVLDVRYQALGEERGLAVHRAALFNVLFDAVKAAGISIETGSQISGLEGRAVILNQLRRAGPFDLIIDALGSRSPLIPYASAPDVRRSLPYGAIWASLPWPGAPFDPHALEQRYDGASVMVGVLPIGRQIEGGNPQTAFFWSLKWAAFEAWRKAGLGLWKERVRALWPETAPLLESVTMPEQMVLARYDHHTLPLPYGEGLVFIGDSAHATSPQLGQGANMALLDVQALTAALAAHDDLADALAAYARMRRLHVRVYQGLSRMFTPFYQSDSRALPLMRDTLVAAGSRLPPVQKLLASIVSGRLVQPIRSQS